DLIMDYSVENHFVHIFVEIRITALLSPFLPTMLLYLYMKISQAVFLPGFPVGIPFPSCRWS
ncbi:hypothetical protein KAT67_03420, partial [candidate division WOR-3 bacterium]|nr:hypothetical protein [candidate division WOR-3 bacterium]